jgi:hypothetical protein
VLAGDDVRLGVDSASEAVVRGDAYTGHENSFLAALSTWASAVSTAVGDPTLATATTAFLAAITTFQGQLPTDLSTKVKVD